MRNKTRFTTEDAEETQADMMLLSSVSSASSVVNLSTSSTLKFKLTHYPSAAALRACLKRGDEALG
jgi:hypothetical protein